jgi:pilus assembly protein FimV
MHVNSRPKIVSFALKTLAGAVASAVFLSSSAYAAGLGKLTVMSSLGQPLRAEIELTAVSNDEASGLVAKLASTEAFRLANIEFNPALMSLRFAIEQRNGRQYVKITSSQPLNEPFVDMLLELSWDSGRLVREYTFLLDPAELRATQSAQVAAPVDVLSQGARAQPASPNNYRPAARPQQGAPAGTAQQESERISKTPSEYKVKPGDTLGRIAGQLKPVDISLDMMLVALYRANPEAFIGNNMNRLKSGQILSVPDTDAIRGTGQGEARGVVVAHAADFNAYRNKLAGQVATAAPLKAPETSQSAAGKITAKVEERPTAANESKDQLKLSKATPAKEAAGKTSAASDEDRIAKDKALAEATARVKELERNVSDLERLMTVKNKAGVEAAKAPVPDLTAAVKPEAAAAPAPAPAKPKPAVKAAPPAPVAEPSLVDMLMDNIVYVGAALAALLLGLLGLSAARRRVQPVEKAPTEPSILGAPTEGAHSLFAETGGQSVDTNNSVFNSSFAPSASQLDTNEVDPVAEADVYIAYGRDAQAEEILKEALRIHPERYPVRLKLLEIYAARKDLRAFETQASEMYGMTKGQGDEWAQAAALGLSVDPQNPLYASASGGAPVAAAPTAEELGQQEILSQQLDDALSAQQPNSELMDLDLELAKTADAQAAEAAPAKAEDNTLDFDLGGLSFEPISHTDPIAMPGPAADSAPAAESVPDLSFTSEPAAPAAAKEEESFDMAFDMAFDTPATAEASAAPAEAKSLDDISLDLGSNDLAADFGTVDLSNEFDLPEIPATPAAAPAAVPDPLMELDSMDFDLPSTPPAPAPAPAEVVDLETHDFFDVPDLPGEAAPAPAAAAPQFDMSAIDLDLPPADQAETALPDFGDNAGGGDISAAHMEMETKLDLAIAYQEIGDKEGARELLDEVIKGGSAEQVGKANEMRQKLA